MTSPASRVLALAVLLASVVAGVGGVPATAEAAPDSETIAGTQIAPDDVSIRIDLTPNGTAEWEIEYRVRLDDENSTEAFESVRRDIEGNESEYTSQFRRRMEATAGSAENATGRNMTVRNVSVVASRKQLPQDYGVIVYRFEWDNFAVAEGNEIRAGDSLAGFFLDNQTSLLFTWPAEYELQSAAPDPSDRRDRTLVWNGPLDFGAGEPTVVVAKTTGGGAGDAEGGIGAAEGGIGAADVLVYGGAVLAAVTLGGVGWAILRRRRGSETAEAGSALGVEASARPSEPPTDAGADTVDSGDAAAASAGESPDRDDTGGAADDSPGETAAEEAEQAPWEDDLLSNEERVLALIEHEGGRLKQQEVAQTLDWTDAKTSQVVRRMRDDDRLDAFRLGRENVLVLPDEDDPASIDA
jgi:hypothetical protein